MIKNSVLFSFHWDPLSTLFKETEKEQVVMDNFFQN